MNIRKAVCILLLGMQWAVMAKGQEASQAFSRTQFYKTMAGENSVAIEQQLEVLRKSAVPGKAALEAALLMKKADLETGAKKKLHWFKLGQVQLENSIRNDSLNPEWHFLRLMIQEHAPGILGYKKELEKDSRFVTENFNKLLPSVKQAVYEYSKHSRQLKAINFKESGNE